MEFLETVEDELSRRVRELVIADPAFSDLLEEVKKGELEPYSASMGAHRGAVSRASTACTEKPRYRITTSRYS